MSDETTIAVRQQEPEGELSIQQLAGNMQKLREVMKSVMKENEDFGVIPGTKSKPTLLKPGAEKLGLMFRFAPQFEQQVVELANDHREYRVKCRLIHIPTQRFVGEASAVCSTMEPKYRYRSGSFSCPECGASAIIKGKADFGGGWLCWGRKGGCGAKFPDDHFDPRELGKVENPDIADTYNTVQQIAQKRAFISAVKTATGSSELFTQDIEDGIVPGAAVDTGDAPQENFDDAKRPAPQRHQASNYDRLVAACLAMGCQKDDWKRIGAVVRYACADLTIQQCYKSQEDSLRVLASLEEKSAHGMTSEQIFAGAMEQAGFAQTATA